MSLTKLSHVLRHSLLSNTARRFSKTAFHLSEVDPALKLSDPCVERLKQIATDGSFLRIAVESGGCSGFQYSFELDTTTNPDDRCFERDGVKVIVDEMSLQFIQGSMIDYHEELIRSAFRVINNPKADLGCSCGASFSVKA